MLPQTPQKKTRPKGQPSPSSLFFAAFLAYVFGAPFGLVLFLVGLGIIFWRVQVSTRNMDKLPPLPPASQEQEIARSEQTGSSSNSQTLEFPSDTSWGRIDPTRSEQTRTDRQPEPVRPTREPAPRIPEIADIPEYKPRSPSREPAPAIKTQPEWSPSIAAYTPPVPERLAGRSTSDATSRPRHRTPGLGVNLATPAGLRHAIVAMTVLGPCRSLEPYQEDPMHTGLPAPRKDSDRTI